MDAVGDMNLKVFEGNFIHFVDLVLGLTQVVHQKLRRNGKHKQAAEFHTGNEHILQILGRKSNTSTSRFTTSRKNRGGHSDRASGCFNDSKSVEEAQR